jgi:hypothetical protein
MTHTTIDQLFTESIAGPPVEPKQLKDHPYSAHQLFIDLINLLEKIKQNDPKYRSPKINFITKKIIIKYDSQFDYNVYFENEKKGETWNALQIVINPDTPFFPIDSIIDEVKYVFNNLIKDQIKFIPLLKNTSLITGFYSDEFIKIMTLPSTNAYISELLAEFSFDMVPCIEMKSNFENIEKQLNHFIGGLIVIVDYNKLVLVNKHMKVNAIDTAPEFFKIITPSSITSKNDQQGETLAPQTIDQIIAILKVDHSLIQFSGFYHVKSVNTFSIAAGQEIIQTNITESTCLNLNLYDLIENPKKMSLNETRQYFEQLKTIYGGQKFVFVQCRALRFGHDHNTCVTYWSNSKFEYNRELSVSDFIVKTHASPNSPFSILKQNGFMDTRINYSLIIKHKITFVKTRDHGYQLFDDLPEFNKAQIENHKDSVIFNRVNYGVVTVIDYPYEVVWTIKDILPLLQTFDQTLTTPFSLMRCVFKQTNQYLSFNICPTNFGGLKSDSKFIVDCNLLVLDSVHPNDTRMNVQQLTTFLQEVLKIKNLYVVFGNNHYKLPFELYFDETSKSLICLTGEEYNSNMYAQGIFKSKPNEFQQYESKMIINDFKDIDQMFAPYLPFMTHDNKYIYNGTTKTIFTPGKFEFAIDNFHRFKIVHETRFAKIYEELPTHSITIINQMPPSDNKPRAFSNYRSLSNFLKSYHDTNTFVALNLQTPQRFVLKFSPHPSLTMVNITTDHYNSVSYNYGNPIPIKEAIEICSARDEKLTIMFQQKMFYLRETMTDFGRLLIPYTLDDLTLDEHNLLLSLPINKGITHLTKNQLDHLYGFVHDNTFPFLDSSFLYGQYINSSVKYVICGSKLCPYHVFEQKWKNLYGIPLIQDIFESSIDVVEKGLTFTFFKLSTCLPIAVHIFN